MINIAMPKGRLGDKVVNLIAKSYGTEKFGEDSRQLVFSDEEKGISYFWVKPHDVAIYVEQGVADVGVVGKDILLEYEPDVYEILDLKLGKCRVAVAAKNGYVEDASRPLRVATKFTGIAKRYYALKGRDIELIKLNGSIELAPLLGMSDVIVDIVETGTTLRENDMSVIEEIAGVSARLIANKASYRFKQEEILKLKDVLSKEI